MLEIIGWRAWFLAPGIDGNLQDDDSNSVSFCALPDTILGMKAFHNDGTGAFYNGYDYYFLAEGAQGILIGVDIETRERNRRADIESRYKNVVIKRGIWTDPQTMRDVEQAMVEAEWPL